MALKNALPYIGRNAELVRELDLSHSHILVEEARGLEEVCVCERVWVRVSV